MSGHQNIKVDGNKVYLRANTGEWFYYDKTEKPLGSGAMGTVYFGRAYNDRYDMVAIKRVAPQIAEIPAVRQRAKTEASLAFRHRNLIEMVGYCEEYEDEGPIFIISRLVQGVPLNKYVEQLRNSPDWVARICRTTYPVMDALTYLHEKGIVHLDIKPSNIMVENGSNIRLMDLGIAYTSKLISSGNGGLLGTPGYAAPEQYIQKGQTEISFKNTTDIYELGATLYDLLSGVKPYSDDSDSLKPIPGVSRPVMKVLSKALQRFPADRYQSAAEFKRALTEAVAGKSAPSRNASGKSGGTPSWLLPVLIGAGAAVLVGLLLILFV
ncbi:MAG: serine/threonine protein kinase [Bacteroidales bacterium]|nr:serine/threonine protein kinase [Bacteroidales bacterium]